MQSTTQQQGGQLKRTMKTRHLIMLSLGGVIGTGLFFNTGYIISTTGAAGTLLAYLIGALVVWLVMQCLGELSVAMPETGAFHVYAARYLGPATGYTVAWLYWLTWTVALGSSFTAAGFCMQYWFPQVPVWIWCVVFCAVIFGLNIISTRFFAEGEFWFSLVKVITIVAFIILGGAAIFGIIPMQDGSPAPGLRNITAEGWFPHGGLPILMTMVAVNFAFSGTEAVSIAAGETENPHKVVPVAIRTTIARLIIFFIGTVFVLASALIPMQQAGVEKSPFVLVFEKVGIPYAADMFNFVILTAILSAANSGLYASGRMLWSLSNEKTLPACFAKVNKRGVPVTALSVSMLGVVPGAVLQRGGARYGVCQVCRAISDLAVVAVWLGDNRACRTLCCARRHLAGRWRR
ncbi:S-methylmethionine permease [Klebsiella pneumoniae]|nr:S-methylmethionine permease [Klebsiella pneumoniae]